MALRTLEQWRLIIEAQKSSGLSVAAFCEQNDINEKSFYNRRAKLGLNTEVISPVFVKAEPIRLAPPPALTLTLGKARLDIPPGANIQWIAGLLKAVTS